MSSTSKGKIVEKIVAEMHDLPGIKVEPNKFLPPVHGKGRKREIDVLLTCAAAGYPIQMAIECKNEETPVGAPEIDAFFGKLHYLGIPPQLGIYVSAIGYTSGAIEGAKNAGIRPLILKGLTKEGLSSEIVEAFQSVVYLLAEVVIMEVITSVSADNVQWLDFYDEEGEICGSIFDLIWQKWRDGQPPSTLGPHELELIVPPSWNHIIDGKIVPILSMTVGVHVTGLVLTLEGQATRHTLVNASNNTVEKSQLNLSFDTSTLCAS